MRTKIGLVLALVVLALAATAQQKQYVVYKYESGSNSLSGAVPPELAASDWYYYKSVGNVLNLLAEHGFVVEQVTGYGYGSAGFREVYLLSKPAGSPSDGIETVRQDDADVTEVARYNLQGLPVNADEKGVQIVVYSNFTARAVIVQ